MTLLKSLCGLIGVALLLSACTDATTSPAGATPQAPANQATATPLAATPTATPEPLAALINGQPLLRADYERQIALYEASMSAAGQDPATADGQTALNEARVWVLDRMIEQVLIIQAAQESGVAISDAEVDESVTALRAEIGEEAFQQRLQAEGLTPEQMRAAMRDNMLSTAMANRIIAQVPTRAEHIHARHILLLTEAEARQVLSQLQAGDDFVTLAQTYSQDLSTRESGGDLGFFPQGILTSAEVESAAFAMQPGQISDVIQSPLGFHIVQVVERAPDMEISPENISLLQAQVMREWIEGLWAKAAIQRYVQTAP